MDAPPALRVGVPVALPQRRPWCRAWPTIPHHLHQKRPLAININAGAQWALPPGWGPPSTWSSYPCVAFGSECRPPDARDCMFCMWMLGTVNAVGT